MKQAGRKGEAGGGNEEEEEEEGRMDERDVTLEAPVL